MLDKNLIYFYFLFILMWFFQKALKTLYELESHIHVDK